MIIYVWKLKRKAGFLKVERRKWLPEVRHGSVERKGQLWSKVKCSLK